MNKNFAIVLSCAVTVLGLASCGNKETDLLKPESKTHTVVFDAQAPAATETKTALHLQVIPDWRNTDVNDVHIFEKETTTSGSYMMEASRVLMETNDDYTKARFYAEFDNASVIVNPPVMETKASSSQFNYTAIMATREGDKYMVPSVQYPHEQSLIDPKADFLVGGSDETYNETLHEQTFMLDFLRPVALARLAITNLEGTKVNEVKITTANYITGYATYEDIDFENKTVDFQGDESNKVLTLLFPEGKKKTTTFYAYFVCMPGTIQFSEIKVYTDEFVFTKTYATPASLTLKGGDFMNIALDMTPKDNNGVTKTGLDPQTLSFVDGDETATEIEFDIYEHELGEFVAPTLVIGEDVVDPTKVEVTSSNEEVAVVEVVEGEFVVTLAGGTGEATITATVPGDDTHAAGSASYKITVVDSTPAPAKPTFYKAEELVDGQEYIIVSNGKAMTLVETKAADLTLDAVEVNAVDGVIETDENVAVWTASTQVEYYTSNNQSYEAGHFALKSGDVYLQRHSNGSEQTLVVGDVPSTGKYYVWDYDGEYLSHLSSATTTFYVGYNNGWGVVYEGTLPKVTLYTTTKPLTKQTLSFGEQPVTAKYDLNGGTWTVNVPTLTGAQTTVTYESSNTAVAEVNDATGEVTIASTAKKGDKATITATAAQTTEYASATASYTIEIIDSSAPATATVYTLVTKEADVVDGNYLIVASADDKIFDGTGTYQGGYTVIADAAAITRDAEKNQITIEGETTAYDFAFAKSGNGFTITGAAGMIVAAEHSGASTAQETYITFAETGGSVFLQRGKLTSDDKALLFSTTRGTSSNEYLYFKSSDDIFKIGGSGSTSGIHLYAANRAAQTLEYSENAVSYDMANGDFVAPTLSGDYHTEVSYTSSKESVATINNEGVVTIKGKGTTTITATAVATADYFSATASYELTVVDSNSQDPKYTKVTSVDGLEEDGQYLLVFEGLANDTDGDGDPKVFNPVLSSDGNTFAKATSSALDVTISSSTIESSDFEDCQFTLEDGYYLKANKAEKYIYPNSTGSSYNASYSMGAESTASHALTISFDNGIAVIKSGSQYLVWSTSSHYFSCNNAVSGQYSTGICLYKRYDARTKQTLAFSADEAKYDLYTEDWTVAVPTLSGAQTSPLTWTSSDESIATVDANGNVTPKEKKGTAIIKVTAPENETYKKGSAHFTVTVFNSNVPKYVKAQAMVSGKSYLIYSNGYLLKNNSTTVAATAVQVNDGVIMYEPDASELWTASDAGELTNNGSYLRLSNNSLAIGSKSSTASNNQWAYTPASDYLKCGNYFLYYTTSNNGKFTVSNSSASNHIATLYVLDDGSTPEPEPQTTSTYTRIAGSAELVSGTYIIADKTDAFLFNATNVTLQQGTANNGGYATITSATGVSKDGTTITLNDNIAAAYEFVFTVTGENLTIKQVGGTHAGQYMFASSSVSNTFIDFKAEATNFTINPQTGDLVYFRTTKGTSTAEYLYKKAADSFFKLGGSGAPGGSDAGVYLYKKN